MERFTVHADVFTQRSRFFATARKPEWLAGDSSKPVDLSDEDPDIFQAYLNCVYVGAETLEEIPGSFESEVRESTGGFPDVWVKNNGKEVITKETPIGYFERFGEIEKVDLHSTGLSPSSLTPPESLSRPPEQEKQLSRPAMASL